MAKELTCSGTTAALHLTGKATDHADIHTLAMACSDARFVGPAGGATC